MIRDFGLISDVDKNMKKCFSWDMFSSVKKNLKQSKKMVNLKSEIKRL